MYFVNALGFFKVEVISKISKDIYRCKIEKDFIPISIGLDGFLRIVDRIGDEKDINKYFLYDTYNKAKKAYEKEHQTFHELIGIIFKGIKNG